MQDTRSIDVFMSMNKDKFPHEVLQSITDMLYGCSNAQWNIIRLMDFKNPNLYLILSLCIGYWGVDRFMLGKYTSGVFKLIIIQLSVIAGIACFFLGLSGEKELSWICGGIFIVGNIWWLMDLCLIRHMTKEYNYKRLIQTLNI